jgi:hypothetical protein
MRFMMLMMADAASEAGAVPDAKTLAAMAEYNQALFDAGVLLAAEGLHPSSRGARVVFTRGRRTVFDGPLTDKRTEAKELIAGFWLIEVESREEAIEWAKRVPFADEEVGEIQVRQVFEMSDFPAELVAEVPEVFEAERAFRERRKAQNPSD